MTTPSPAPVAPGQPANDPKIISVVNLKGGVGKTALSVNLAAYLGRIGEKTLLIDVDPQTNATFWCMSYEDWEGHSTSKGTVSDLLGARRHRSPHGHTFTAEDSLVKEVFRNVDLIPSHLDLFTVDLDIGGEVAREKKLKKSVTSILPNYKYVILDCPPNLTIPTQNALAMSSHYVVPVSPDHLSAIGVGLLLNRVKTFCEDIEHQTRLAGIVFSRIGRTAEHRGQVIRDLSTTFSSHILSARITERVVVSECAANRIAIIDSSNQDAKDEIRAVCKEIIGRL